MLLPLRLPRLTHLLHPRLATASRPIRSRGLHSFTAFKPPRLPTARSIPRPRIQFPTPALLQSEQQRSLKVHVKVAAVPVKAPARVRVLTGVFGALIPTIGLEATASSLRSSDITRSLFT